jgi:hypothetical protein
MDHINPYLSLDCSDFTLGEETCDTVVEYTSYSNEFSIKDDRIKSLASVPDFITKFCVCILPNTIFYNNPDIKISIDIGAGCLFDVKLGDLQEENNYTLASILPFGIPIYSLYNHAVSIKLRDKSNKIFTSTDPIFIISLSGWNFKNTIDVAKLKLMKIPVISTRYRMNYESSIPGIHYEDRPSYIQFPYITDKDGNREITCKTNTVLIWQEYFQWLYFHIYVIDDDVNNYIICKFIEKDDEDYDVIKDIKKK